MQRELRRKAVDMFLNGVKKTSISKQLGVSRRSVYKWVKAHDKSGEKGLKICKRGCPKGFQLKPWQCTQIVKTITDYCPDQLSMPFFLWTRDSVSLLIHRIFNIKLSKCTVGRYLDK